MTDATSSAYSRHVVVCQYDLLKPTAVAQAGGQSACQVVGPQVQYLHASRVTLNKVAEQQATRSGRHRCSMKEPPSSHEALPQGEAAGWLPVIQWS